MLVLIALVPLQVVLICCFCYHRRRKKKLSMLLFVAFLLVCCSIGLVVFDFYDDDDFQPYYTYEVNIDNKTLEAFCIDFDTPQQYEEWFQSDSPIEMYGKSGMRKELVFEEPYSKVFIDFFYYEDPLYAMTGYARIVQSSRPVPYRPTTEVSLDYEYTIGDAYCYKAYNGFWYMHDGKYNTNAIIRYKNVVFSFAEYPEKQRDSRIGEAIDLLWADYEQYKKDMNLL